MSVNFITFGSHGKYIDCAKRLARQATLLNAFQKINLYTSADLNSDDFPHKEFIDKNPRGYGYWLWKPYFIKKNFDSMNDGDILLYLDSGCEIDFREKSDFTQLLEIVKRDKILGTYTCLEKEYNKMDLLIKLDVNAEMYINNSQHQAGAIMFFICNETRKIVNEWYALCCDYHLIDDSPSIVDNYLCFKEHRHDQSIFSLLTKKYNCYSRNWLTRKCIHYARNISNISIFGDIQMNYTFDEKTATPLCEIMGLNKSDKGSINITQSWHNYTTLYYSLFKDLKYNPLRIFELGLGTNNMDVPSNMGSGGRPGASLYGWKEFFPNANIFGADIDSRILFNTDRISTFYCDQTKPEVIQNMWNTPELTEGFDIIIEDGLHTYSANVCFFENSIHKLKPSGYYVIEDIQFREKHLFDNKIREWRNKYTDCVFTFVELPSSRNSHDNNVLIVYKSPV